MACQGGLVTTMRVARSRQLWCRLMQGWSPVRIPVDLIDSAGAFPAQIQSQLRFLIGTGLPVNRFQAHPSFIFA